jgi:hypothetical protein
MELAALLISILALVVSGLSVRYSREQSRSSAALANIEVDRRAEEVARVAAEAEQAKKADVDIRLAAREANSSAKLVVSNDGPANASQVSVGYVRPLSSGGTIAAFKQFAQRRFDLRSGDIEVIRLDADFDTAPRFEVAVRWTDPAGDHERVRLINLMT